MAPFRRFYLELGKLGRLIIAGEGARGNNFR